MSDITISDEEYRLYKEIEKRQNILDEGWNKPKKKRWFIGDRDVSEEEYINYHRKQEEIRNNYRQDEHYTSTGEEWETDSDGDYIPDWLHGKI